MGFEKLTKMIIVKILSLFFWNHFVKIVGCLIKIYTNFVEENFDLDAKIPQKMTRKLSNEEAVRAV